MIRELILQKPVNMRWAIVDTFLAHQTNADLKDSAHEGFEKDVLTEDVGSIGIL